MFENGTGIDLRTQITSAARRVDSTLVFVRYAGSHHIPSFVAYDDDKIFVGHTANTHKNVVFESKRVLVEKFGETCSRYLESDPMATESFASITIQYVQRESQRTFCNMCGACM